MTFTAGAGARGVLTTVLSGATFVLIAPLWWFLGVVWCVVPLIGAVFLAVWYVPRLVRSLWGTLCDDVLVVRRGVWWRRETTVPLNGMRTFEVWTTPLQRVFRCRTVIVRFAGGRVLLPLLDEKTARRLLAWLEEY